MFFRAIHGPDAPSIEGGLRRLRLPLLAHILHARLRVTCNAAFATRLRFISRPPKEKVLDADLHVNSLGNVGLSLDEAARPGIC